MLAILIFLSIISNKHVLITYCISGIRFLDVGRGEGQDIMVNKKKDVIERERYILNQS